MSFYEEQYPGNAAVFENLLSAMQNEGVTAFTGAGTSMPAMLSWRALVDSLVNDAAKEGLLDPSAADALRGESSDLLYVIDEIYNACGAAQTKAKVSKLFSLEKATDAHKLIVMTAFKQFMTLNYDQGLEIAHAEQLSRHVRSITAKNSSEIDQWIRDNSIEEISSVLHWHGKADDASSIILSGSDYINFYDNEISQKENIRNIFNTRRILMLGFGFSDNFIERELNSVMQGVSKPNSHFAIIGLDADKNYNLISERRKYLRKYKLETIFYPVERGANDVDHSALISLLEEIARIHPRIASGNNVAIATQNTTALGKITTVNYKSSLFMIDNRQIYCEPNLWKSVSDETNAVGEQLNLPELINGGYHCIITAPHEYGLSNIGRRVAFELNASGRKGIFREAEDFPKYKKAILIDRDMAAIDTSEKFTLILDNFSIVDHQRTLRELLAVYDNIRIILLNNSNRSSAANSDLMAMRFQHFELRGMSRTNIREVINIIAPNYNSDTTSTIVDKVYSDLLQLCIPLTPSNVIMYSSVLCKDGNFSPVSSLHIVDRFISEALQRASDAYADAFNSINKKDLVSAFSHYIFHKNTTVFSEGDWCGFCEKYKSENLVEFSSTEILGDLYNGRIISRDGSLYYFRYRMFFSYFVGRYISLHPNLLSSIIEENKYLELNGLIEVLCGLLSDCSAVLDDLTTKLSSSLESFYSKYPIKNLDFHEGARWENSHSEKALWEAVEEKIDSGPTSTKELDILKTSIQAERRTDDQKVSIIKFIASELGVNTNTFHLTTALESASHASASSKKKAAIAVLNGYALAYEVATVFIPLIAAEKYVSWNGFTYVNLIEDEIGANEPADKQKNKERMQNLVAYSLPTSFGKNVSDFFGSRRLGQVFLALMDEQKIDTSVKKYLLFSLLIRSKPTGWLDGAKKRIAMMKRDDLYLRHMLSGAMRQFKEEINTEAERQLLKQLIASVRLRRDRNVKVANQKNINQVIERLDQKGVWSEENLPA